MDKYKLSKTFISALNKEVRVSIDPVDDPALNPCKKKLNSARTLDELMNAAVVCLRPSPKTLGSELSTAFSWITAFAMRLSGMMRGLIPSGFLGPAVDTYVQYGFSYGPYALLYSIFCSDRFMNFMRTLYEAFKRIMNSFSLNATEVAGFAQAIARGMFETLQSLGAIPPGFNVDILIKLMEKELQVWSNSPSMETMTGGSISKLCQTLKRIHDWRYDSMNGASASDQEEQLMKDVWEKLQSAGTVSIEVYDYTTQLLSGVATAIANNPGLTIAAVIGIAIAAFCVVTAGACVVGAGAAAPVAAAILLICSMYNISIGDLTEDRIKEMLMSGTA
jgi:hypothetical protein